MSETVTWTWLVGLFIVIIGALVSTVAWIAWSDRNTIWKTILDTKLQIDVTNKKLEELRYSVGTTVATRGDLKEVKDLVQGVLQNQHDVALALFKKERE